MSNIAKEGNDGKSGVHLREGYFRSGTTDRSIPYCYDRNSQLTRLLGCVRYETLFLSGRMDCLAMKGATKERWMELCEQATVEQDPQKLLELARQINDLLEEKERRLGITPPRCNP